LPYLYTEAVVCLGVALLLAEENMTQWGSAIGYFVVVELRVALSLLMNTLVNDGLHSDWSGPRGELLTAPNLV